jgi:hypothetical protein
MVSKRAKKVILFSAIVSYYRSITTNFTGSPKTSGALKHTRVQWIKIQIGRPSLIKINEMGWVV